MFNAFVSYAHSYENYFPHHAGRYPVALLVNKSRFGDGSRGWGPLKTDVDTVPHHALIVRSDTQYTGRSPLTHDLRPVLEIWDIG